MRASIFAAATIFLVAASSRASTIDFTGAFQHDDDLAVFHYSVQDQSSVTIQTTSFAAGGFIPLLFLFDTSGVTVFQSDGFLLNSDASISFVSDAAAVYTIILSEYDNYPNSFLLSDGYTRTGQGDFTGAFGCGNGRFCDPSGAQLTGDWAVTFSSTDPTLTAQLVPEPGSACLLMGGLLVMAWGRRRSARSVRN